MKHGGGVTPAGRVHHQAVGQTGRWGPVQDGLGDRLVVVFVVIRTWTVPTANFASALGGHSLEAAPFLEGAGGVILRGGDVVLGRGPRGRGGLDPQEMDVALATPRGQETPVG